MKLEAVPVDLMQVLQDPIMAVKVIASKRIIKLEIQTDEESITILGDRSGLSQVFINPINNAFRFSPEGKAVSVTVNRRAEYASIAITDHGLESRLMRFPIYLNAFTGQRTSPLQRFPAEVSGCISSSRSLMKWLE